MFPNATVSSRSSSSRSGGNSCSRNSSMPSLRMRSPLSPKTSYNPLFRHSDAFTSFDASNFIFNEHKRKDRKNPILRRYNSHDSHTNFGDVRIEMKGDTPESTKSRSGSRATPDTSPDSTGNRKVPEFEARDFLERYSLPRVVRVADGEPLLLYRCFDSFTKVQAKGVIVKKGKEKQDAQILHFPEGYGGWFSLTNEKGEKCAVTYSSILQLVREQVCSFISIQPFTAYTGQNAEPSEMPGKVQYLKTTVRGGQLFQLRAVFQHRDRPDSGRHSTKSSKLTARTSRDKDLANRYAQLISQNNQELYVPLTTKGEFYEIHSSMKARLCFPGLLDKTGPLALDKDCLYKITHLLRRVALPLKVKLLSGPLPSGLPKDFTDTFILERKFQEPLMVTCTLPSPSEANKHEISCISLNSNVKISKCMLGFDSENRLFKSQRLQAALAFCHKNVENWYREVRLAPNLEQKERLQQRSLPNPSKSSTLESCKECKESPNGACAGCYIREDTEQKQIITKEVMEKFPKSKKWYKHLRILGGTEPVDKQMGKVHVEGVEKVKSIERYKDMSKLIEEKFGKKTSNPVKKSASFMFSTKRIDLEETPDTNKGNPALLKCQSLDNQLYSSDETKINKKEDKTHFLKRRQLSGDTKLETRSSKSNISDSLSYDFQMCILNNDTETVESVSHKIFSKKSVSLQITDLDEISSLDDSIKPLKKTKPDLIPTLTKDNSYITDRLCSEFHVKTKVQKRPHSKLNDKNDKTRGSCRLDSLPLVNREEEKVSNHVKSVVVQVHEVSKAKVHSFKTTLEIDDIPYSKVADEVCQRPSGKKSPDENIYAEICETACNCDTNKLCECKRTRKEASEYCYVKLGSNGDSVTSDSDEAIYNTLR